MLVPAHLTLVWTFKDGSSLGVGLLLPLFLEVRAIKLNSTSKSDVNTLEVMNEKLKERGLPRVELISNSEIPLGCGLASSAAHVVGTARSLYELSLLTSEEALELAYESEVEAGTGIADAIVIWRSIERKVRPPAIAIRLLPWSKPSEAIINFKPIYEDLELLINPFPSPTSQLLAPDRLKLISSVGEKLLREVNVNDLREVFKVSRAFSEIAYPEGVKLYEDILQTTTKDTYPLITLKKMTLIALGTSSELAALKELLRERGKLSREARIIPLRGDKHEVSKLQQGDTR